MPKGSENHVWEHAAKNYEKVSPRVPKLSPKSIPNPPKRGNKGGNKEHNSQVAPGGPQELQNEPKLMPQSDQIEIQKGPKPSKTQTKGRYHFLFLYAVSEAVIT